MIKYFNIYPSTFDIDNLHETQKLFLVNLAGVIPKQEDWSVNVRYFKKKLDIEEIKSIQLKQEEIDLAELHGTDIEELKHERLVAYKKKLLDDLDLKYGLKSDIDKHKENSELLNKITNEQQAKIYDLIFNKPETTTKDGL